MDQNLNQLAKITLLIAKAVDGEHLTAEETEDVFKNIFIHDLEGYHLAVMLAALHAKGGTADELFGFYNSQKKLGIQLNSKINPNKVIDISGTGGGSFKSINVSTTAAFVLAAAGYTIPKAAYFAVTSTSGSADIFKAFGVDIFKLSKKDVEEALAQVGISPLFLPLLSPKLANRSKLSRKILVERQIRIRTPFHLVSNALRPMKMNYRVYGCYSEKYLEVLAGMFSKIGFKRSLTVHAKIGMPEFVNHGVTVMAEQLGNKVTKYKVRPSDFGIKEAALKDLRSSGPEQNVVEFLRILKGQEFGAKSDLVGMNAAGAFYILENHDNFKKPLIKAKEILAQGLGYQVLQKLVSGFGDKKLLKHWEEKAKL